jgi:hypothetical protein
MMNDINDLRERAAQIIENDEDFKPAELFWHSREKALATAVLIFSTPVYPHQTETIRFLFDQKPNILIQLLKGNRNAAAEIADFDTYDKKILAGIILGVKAKFQRLEEAQKINKK